LTDRFGHRGYIYVGDAEADVPVWREAAKAVTVNPSRTLKAKVEALGPEVQHLSSRSGSAKAYLKALRPHQWLKNFLVFLPMLAAHKWDAETFGQSLLAFVAFSLVASGVYVLNDLLDLSADRAHPRKRNRPLASGALPIAHGTWLVPILLLSGLAFAIPLGSLFVLVLLGYCSATTAYSLWLKRHMIIDICTLAGLYTTRVVAGGVATGIPLSVWLLAFSIFFFFSLAAVKRQAELIDGVATGAVTAHGRSYHVNDLPVVASMATASGYVSVLVMALYLNSPTVSALYSYPEALWGICLVLLYWISRMVMATNRGNMHDDPLVFAVKDRISLICLALVVGFAVGGVLL
jgi:4-hydroxybenzoate polyprenyltransferase